MGHGTGVTEGLDFYIDFRNDSSISSKSDADCSFNKLHTTKTGMDVQVNC